MSQAQDMLAVVEGTWQTFDAAIANLDDAALIKPGVVGDWSVKDLIGHVTAWEQIALSHVDRWRRGDTAPLDATPMDAFNASEADQRHAWSLLAIQTEASETRQRLRTTLEQLTDDDWQAVVVAGEERRSLGEWIGGALGGRGGPGTHAAEHAEHIWAWRNHR